MVTKCYHPGPTQDDAAGLRSSNGRHHRHRARAARSRPRVGHGPMADRHLIGPARPASPATAASARGPRSLPADLLRDASRRLGIMSLVGAGLWTLGTLL